MLMRKVPSLSQMQYQENSVANNSIASSRFYANFCPGKSSPRTIARKISVNHEMINSRANSRGNTPIRPSVDPEILTLKRNLEEAQYVIFEKDNEILNLREENQRLESLIKSQEELEMLLMNIQEEKDHNQFYENVIEDQKAQIDNLTQELSDIQETSLSPALMDRVNNLEKEIEECRKEKDSFLSNTKKMYRLIEENESLMTLYNEKEERIAALEALLGQGNSSKREILEFETLASSVMKLEEQNNQLMEKLQREREANRILCQLVAKNPDSDISTLKANSSREFSSALKVLNRRTSNNK